MTDTERRDRYAEAFFGGVAPRRLSAEDWLLIGAAMTVADLEAESIYDRAVSAEREVARLRRTVRDLESVIARQDREKDGQWKAITRLRAELEDVRRWEDVAKESLSLGQEMADEIARLRDERENARLTLAYDKEVIDRLRAELGSLAQAHSELMNRAADYVSTIERVREVLNGADISDRESGFYMDIRAALEGSTDD